jgi:hypothetical protein
MAKIATDAFGLDHSGVSNAIHFLELKALVSSVLTSNVTKIAANAVLLVDVGNDVVIEVEVSPIGDT